MKTKRIENLIINDSSIRNSIYDAILFLIETSNELARSLRTVDELSLGDDIRNDIEGRIQYMQTRKRTKRNQHQLRRRKRKNPLLKRIA